MRRPLLVLFLAWVAGLLLANLVQDPGFLLLVIVTTVLLFFGVLLSGRCTSRDHMLWLLALLMIVLGFLRFTLVNQAYQRRLEQTASIVTAHPSYVRGQLMAQFQRADERRWVARINGPSLWDGKTWRALPGPVEIVSSTETQPAGEAGQQVEFSGRWKPVAGASLSVHEWQQSTGTVGTLKAKEGPTSQEEPASLSFLAWLVRARDHWRCQIREWMLSQLPGDAGGLALAMTTGERGYLSEEVRRGLLESGLYHLTAISGLNVTVVLLTLPLFLKLIGVPMRWRALAGIPLAILLLGLVGAQVSVLRATIMGVTLMLALFMDRPSDVLNSLAAAGLIILVAYPSEVHQPGFLLSFLTVVALILGGFAQPARAYRIEVLLQKWFKPGVCVHSLVSAVTWMGTGLWASFVATLAVAPVSAWFFHTVAWKAVLANLVAVPIAETMTVLGILVAFGLAFLPGLSGLLSVPLALLSRLLLACMEWISSWSFGFDVVMSPDLVIISLLLAVGVVMLLPAEWFNPPVLSRRVSVLLLLAALSWWPLLPASREFRIHFLDVGQGDSCLLQFPRGETLLVDTGPPPQDSPSRLGALTDALLATGIHHLDAVVITHPEEDHVGGLPQILDTFPVGSLLATGDTNESPSFKELARLLKDCQVPVTRLLAGDHLSGISDATITAIYPGVEDLLHSFESLNERSLVLLIEQAGLRVLLSGDISGDVESELIERSLLSPCAILKVPHHGSRYSSSSDFLEKVKPALAVIQCGDNLFGHPALETVQRLEEAGASVLTTRSDGTVQLAWDGEQMTMKTSRPGNGWR